MKKYVVFLNDVEIIVNERKGKKQSFKKGQVVVIDKLPGKDAKTIKVFFNKKVYDIPSEVVIKDFKDLDWQMHLHRAYVNAKTGILI